MLNKVFHFFTSAETILRDYIYERVYAIEIKYQCCKHTKKKAKIKYDIKSCSDFKICPVKLIVLNYFSTIILEYSAFSDCWPAVNLSADDCKWHLFKIWYIIYERKIGICLNGWPCLSILCDYCPQFPEYTSYFQK